VNYVFLFCSERSGSNLISSLANGHSEVCGPPPSHMFRLFGTNRSGYEPLDSAENWQEFAADFTEAHQSMLGDWNTSFHESELLDACPNETMKSAFDFMYGLECQHDGANIAFVKENHTYLFADFLVTNWPDCRFVHQVRDPRDVAASWVKTDSITGGVERAIDVWIKDQSRTLEIIENMNEPGKFMQLRYEDLLLDEVKSARLLCQHLQIQFEPEMLNFHQDSRTQRNAQKIDAWSNLAKPVLKNNAGKYHADLSPNDVRYIELRCSTLMKAFGYGLDTEVEGLSAEEIEVETNQLGALINKGKPLRISSPAEIKTRARRKKNIDRVLARIGESI
jgi:hypothetical protein